MPVTKLSVSFPDRTMEQINNFASASHQEAGISTKIQEIIRDYSALIVRSIKEVAPLFSEAEWNYLRDALNGVTLTPDISYRLALTARIGEGAKFDNLAEKWSVDADYLASKILGLHEFDAYAVAKSIDAFWVKQ